MNQWDAILQAEQTKPYYIKLMEFIGEERSKYEVYPAEEEVFTAFSLTPLAEVKVLILGQDPYHDKNQAHGLSFSVKAGVKIPPSLNNIFKELKSDLGVEPPFDGNLSKWAIQGVLLLNAVLTVRAHSPNSHKDQGWEHFTDHIIQVVSASCPHVVFVLWGRYAQNKAKLINQDQHTIIQSAHPSPLSAKNGFLGSAPFSKINYALIEHHQTPINW